MGNASCVCGALQWELHIAPEDGWNSVPLRGLMALVVGLSVVLSGLVLCLTISRWVGEG